MTAKETPEIGVLLERYDQLRDAGKDPIFTAASIGHWVAEHRHLLRTEPLKSGTHEDTRRLRRFAEMALAVEGKDETFGSQLTADRELGFLREDFLGEHAKGADAYTAFCRAIDNLTDSAELPPKPGPSPTADEDGRCTRCGCRFEDPRELTHECPPGFQLPSEDSV